jgi:excinuclease ABC subunit B
LRLGTVDVLIGINLLREGLDLPEVSLVAILDADKEGFLRSETSLIQTAGRAARHVGGQVILYADRITGSMKKLIDITKSRRERQLVYNKEHNITPLSVVRAVQQSLGSLLKGREIASNVLKEDGKDMDTMDILRELEEEMLAASADLQFEKAALLRDQMMELKKRTDGGTVAAPAEPVKYRSVASRSTKQRLAAGRRKKT